MTTPMLYLADVLVEPSQTSNKKDRCWSLSFVRNLIKSSPGLIQSVCKTLLVMYPLFWIYTNRHLGVVGQRVRKGPPGTGSAP